MPNRYSAVTNGPTTLQVTEVSLNPPLGWSGRERRSTAAKSPQDADLGNLSRHPLNSEPVQIDLALDAFQPALHIDARKSSLRIHHADMNLK